MRYTPFAARSSRPSGGVAQRQSRGLISPVSQVQFLPPPPHNRLLARLDFLAVSLNVPENVPVAQTTSGVLQIGWTNDVVAIEDRACEMSGDRHRHTLGHATTDQVARRGPSEVVTQLPRHPSVLARGQPRLAEVVALFTDY